jgi:hypothetical protein
MPEQTPVIMPEQTPVSKVPGWNEWARRVVDDIERLESKQEKLTADVLAIRVETAALRAKTVLISQLEINENQNIDKKCQT